MYYAYNSLSYTVSATTIRTIFYKNAIYIKINNISKDIKDKYNKKMLEEKETLFLNFEPYEIEDFVDEFVNSEVDINYMYEKNIENLYSEFCEFLSSKIED